MEFEFEDYSDISFEINNNKLFFSTFTIYSILYFLAYTNLSFSEAITPINFINKGHYYSHQLVAYYMSTIYSFITSSCGVLFVCGLLSLENIRSVYYFSFGYLLADIIYIILVSKLTKSYKKYIIIILHHIVMMFIFFEYCFIEDDDTFLRNYFVSLILIANYTNLIINICWYIKNTNHNYIDSEFYKLIHKILLITYFCTRIINLLYICFQLRLYHMIFEYICVMSVVILNSYWFYKLYINNKNKF